MKRPKHEKKHFVQNSTKMLQITYKVLKNDKDIHTTQRWKLIRNVKNEYKSLKTAWKYTERRKHQSKFSCPKTSQNATNYLKTVQNDYHSQTTQTLKNSQKRQKWF